MLDILLWSGLAGAAMMAGVALMAWKHDLAHDNLIYLISFSAGIVLATAFLYLIPASQALNANALTVALIGFVLFFLIENLTMVHACHEEECPEHAVGIVAGMGLGFHSLLDGLAIGIGFEVNPALGFAATLAVLLHNIPMGVAMMSVMRYSKIALRRAVGTSLLVAIATPLGALAAYLLALQIPAEHLGLGVGLSAGSFLYIGAADLIPEAHKGIGKAKGRWVAAAFLLGICLVAGSLLI